MTAFLDTNVVIALLDENDPRHEWSWEEFTKRKLDGPILISDIVYCEVSVGMADKDALDSAILALGLEQISADKGALFSAGRAFITYKNDNKGPKLGVLPDFLIGAVAVSHDSPLLTANAKDFINYFPELIVAQPPSCE